MINMSQTKNSQQQGFSPVIILIAAGVVLAILAVGVLIFTSKKPATNSPSTEKLTVPLTKKDPLLMEAQAKLGTPDCPEFDYNGCDTSGNFATWKDDGQRNPDETKDRVNPYTGVIYSK